MSCGRLARMFIWQEMWRLLFTFLDTADKDSILFLKALGYQLSDLKRSPQISLHHLYNDHTGLARLI